MRVTVAILITLFLLGGVFGYIRFADSIVREPVNFQPDYSESTYSVTIERTFECEPFLDTPAMVVKFKNENVLSVSDNISPDTDLEIDELPGVERGENELFLTANLSMSHRGLAIAKVTIRRDGIVLAEELISGSGIGVVAGTVPFFVGESQSGHNHDH